MPTVIERHIHSAKRTAAALRWQERRWLLFASTVLALGLLLTYRAKTDEFDVVRTRLEAGALLNLNDLQNTDSLLNFFGAHYADSRDRQFIAGQVLDRLSRLRSRPVIPGSMPNVGYLNLIRSPAREIEEHGGAHLRERLQDARNSLGLTPDLIEQELNAPKAYPAHQPASNTGYTVAGRVTGLEDESLQGVLVALSGTLRTDTLRTDQDGRYTFTGLAPGDTLAVRAAKPYYAFSSCAFRNLAEDKTCNLEGREHRVRLVAADIFSRVKPDFVVRSPDGFKRSVLLMALIFFGIFWGIHLFWTARRFAGDALLLPVVHLLSGVGFLLMTSLPDPLRDRFLAFEFVIGIAVGGVLLAAISQIDVQDWGRRLSYGGWKSFLWLGLAGLVSAALLLFGFGPTGSDAKVNLSLGFLTVQPVEFIKACLLLFFAGYLACNWRFLRDLEQDDLPRWLSKLKVTMPRFAYVVPIVLGVGVALLFFFLQKDLGPALVICCTFLILYGIVRRRWVGVSFGFAGLVAGFTAAYLIGFPSTVVQRVEMLRSAWDNYAWGGDHLAHAYWTLATGGLTGQGLGEGSPHFMPASHTDMVLAAIGEEIGLVGLLMVLVLYGVFLHRGITIVMRRGTIFSFFLGAGIVISSACQLFLIAGGTLGLLPLSGVVSPFLSYGKSSMMMHFAFTGVLFSLSANPGTPELQQEQQKRFARPVRAVSLVFLGLLVVLGLRAAYIQVVQANRWAIKPALVIQRGGKRGFAYNPRIYQVRNHIPAGTLYDRNGIPLAISNMADLDKHRIALEALGVDVDELRASEQRRLYPFGSLTFYLLGDLNTRIKWGATNSLYAENRYLSRLRGYDNHPEQVFDQRTVNGQVRVDTLVRYDYAALRPFVRHGVDSRQFRHFLARDRDLHLTIDIRLQQRVAELIRDKAQEPAYQGKTISAVVLDPATGDVLTSVTYPLPEQIYTDPAAAAVNVNLFDRGFGAATIAPGSTLKLATAMAALRKGGTRASSWTVDVSGDERYYRRRGPRGRIAMPRAIEASSNVYFATIASERVGAAAMLEVLEALDFRVGTGTPTRRQKLDRLNQPGNLAQAGFGQGVITASPLQVARLSAVVASVGLVAEPEWLLEQDNPRQEPQRLLAPEAARRLGAYMRRVVTGREGTARSLRDLDDLGIPATGKTGTAEQDIFQNGRRVRRVNHAWFTGYAPYLETSSQAPQIAVAVLVETGGSGGRIAGPIARAIFIEAQDLGLIGPSSSSQ